MAEAEATQAGAAELDLKRYNGLIAGVSKINGLYRSIALNKMYLVLAKNDDSPNHHVFYDAVSQYNRKRSGIENENSYSDSGWLIFYKRGGPLNTSFFERIGKPVPEIIEVSGKPLSNEDVYKCLTELETAVLRRSGVHGEPGDFAQKDVMLLMYYGSNPQSRNATPPKGGAKKRASTHRRLKSRTASAARRRSNRRNRRRTARK